MDTESQKLKDQVASLANGDLRRAFLEATKNYTFANDACREASFKLIGQAVKRQADGSYVAEKENLPLAYFIESRPWFQGMLAPVRETPAPHVPFGRNEPTLDAEGHPFRGPVGAVDIDTIQPGMTPEARAAARVAINAELKKL